MSDNVVQGPESWQANMNRSLEPDPEPSGDLAGGGGPPHDPGMEARVSALEASFGDVKAILARLEPTLGRVDDRTRKIEAEITSVDGRLRKIETDTFPKLGADIAELKGRVSQLPSTIQIIGFVLAVLTLAGLSKYLGH